MTSIRPVTDQDLDAIVAIYNYYIEETVVSYEEKALSRKEMAVRIKRVLDAGYPWLVAEESDEVLGYCYAY
jgi:L-amino acid N-acyltransferase YncA